MFKKTLILLLSSFFTIAGAPEFLIASEDVEVNSINNANIVQTVVPEPVKTVVSTPVTRTTKTTVAKAAAPKPAANRLNIAGRSLVVEYSPNTGVDAGRVVKFYNNKFLYGHNSAGVFGFLPSVGVGTVFSLTYNGVTTNYRVMEKVEYAKSSPTTLNLNGRDYSMAYIAKGMNKYSLTLMTCSGRSLGGGDATHRLVLYANAI
jgi:hypothetical protein